MVQISAFWWWTLGERLDENWPATIKLDGFSGKTKIRIRAQAFGGYRGDIAIDEINLSREPEAADRTWIRPTRTDRFGRSHIVSYSEQNGDLFCSQNGFSRMKSYATGCAESNSYHVTAGFSLTQGFFGIPNSFAPRINVTTGLAR